LYSLDIPPSDDRKREAYRQKIAECMDRAEKLKDLIEQQKGIGNYFHLFSFFLLFTNVL
jgi:hypothetical protein